MCTYLCVCVYVYVCFSDLSCEVGAKRAISMGACLSWDKNAISCNCFVLVSFHCARPRLLAGFSWDGPPPAVGSSRD